MVSAPAGATTAPLPSPARTAAAVASALGSSLPSTGCHANAPRSAAGSAVQPSWKASRPSYADFPALDFTSAGFSPATASALTTTAVEFASLGEPGTNAQPPSSFWTDFSQSTLFLTAASWPPSVFSACTAIAVAFVSYIVAASHAAPASARKEAKPPFAQLWAASQPTASLEGWTPTVCWASSATDCRHTPSYVGSFFP